jgi:SprT-like family
MSAMPRLPLREHQLEMEFPAAPVRVRRLPDADAMLTVLCALGLHSITRCRLTRNRTVMVSFRGDELRVHEAFLEAPNDVLQAIVAFVQGRGVARRRAKGVIVGYPIGARPAPLRREQTHPDDMLLVARLLEIHARCNRDHFDRALRTPAIRVSRRMRSALGSYHPARADERGAEIVISRRHIRRHGWAAACETLLHEMVHQWQDESGLSLDHGATFRRKARQVGITASSRRHPERTPLDDLSRSA